MRDVSLIRKIYLPHSDCVKASPCVRVKLSGDDIAAAFFSDRVSPPLRGPQGEHKEVIILNQRLPPPLTFHLRTCRGRKLEVLVLKLVVSTPSPPCAVP